jgi:hypothetical protein
MTAIQQHESGGRGKFLLFLLIVMAVAASIWFIARPLDALDAPPPPGLMDVVKPGNLSSLPMTHHAQKGRANDLLGAEEIRQMIDKRACKPIEVWICPQTNQAKLLCRLRPGEFGDEIWAGVIVAGDYPHPIITGFVAPYHEYWKGTFIRDGCWRATRLN